eukprot:scaffold17.g548.t1
MATDLFCEPFRLATSCTGLSTLPASLVARAATLTLLVLSGGLVDLVLVPRVAKPTDELCIPFVLFLTKVSGCSLLSTLTVQRKVAVMLDLDATLLESEHLLQQPLTWGYQRWQPVLLRSGPAATPMAAAVAELRGEPHHAEAVMAVTWTARGLHHSYIVRRRPGWQDLRRCLVEAWAAHHHDSVFGCEPYKPVVHQPTTVDDGRVLRDVAAMIRRFHAHCYAPAEGREGGAVGEVRRAAEELLCALQTGPIAAVGELNRHIAAAERRGEQLWRTISLAGFLERERAAASAATAAESAPTLMSTDQENLTPSKNLTPSAVVVGPPASSERVLRPSSRQAGAPDAGAGTTGAERADLPAVQLALAQACIPLAPLPREGHVMEDVVLPSAEAVAAAGPVTLHLSVCPTQGTARVVLRVAAELAPGGEAAVRMVRLQGDAVELESEDVEVEDVEATLLEAAGGENQAPFTSHTLKRELVEVIGAAPDRTKRRSTDINISMPTLSEDIDIGSPTHSLEADAIVVNQAPSEAAEHQQKYLQEHEDRTIRCIVLLVAMEAEAAPMVDSLGLKRDEPAAIPPPAPCVHLVTFGKCKVNGVDQVGTVPAALMTYLAVQSFSPDVVISAGTAGGFRGRGAAIADVFVSTLMVNHDRRIPIPGFDSYGVGEFAALPTPALQAALALKSGVVTSGNSLDYTAQDMEAALKLQETVPRVVEFVAGKKYSEL